MDFSRQFTVKSDMLARIQAALEGCTDADTRAVLTSQRDAIATAGGPDLQYTFRRLTMAERAALELAIANATRDHARDREKLEASGASAEDLATHRYLSWLSAEAPLTLKTILISVSGYLTPTAFVDGVDTPRELIEESYAFGIKGVRLTTAQLGEWLSPTTSPQAGQGGATNSTAPSACAPNGTARANVGDTSLTA